MILRHQRAFRLLVVLLGVIAMAFVDRAARGGGEQVAVSRPSLSLSDAIELARTESGTGQLVQVAFDEGVDGPAYLMAFLEGSIAKRVRVELGGTEPTRAEVKPVDAPNAAFADLLQRELADARLDMPAAIRRAAKVADGCPRAAQFEVSDGKLLCNVQVIGDRTAVTVKFDTGSGQVLAVEQTTDQETGQPPASRERKLNTARIDEITGAKGTFNEAEGVYKESFPRADVPVKIDGRPVEPFMGLTSWAAFQPGKAANAMVMGDLVLFEDEVNPVMSAALDSGLQVTALHNHFFYDEPRVYFMHIGGEGLVEQLATGVRRALDSVKQVRAARSEPARGFGRPAVPTRDAISAKPLEDILATKGQAKDGMFKAVFGRTVRMACGCEVGKEMGVNTWAAFAGTDDLAVVDGDFVVSEEELQPVLKALRMASINVVAIHHHMVGESPRTIFLHYWATGPAVELARGVKSALDAQATVSAPPKAP